jgi:SAM-dependent methyltransferase
MGKTDEINRGYLRHLESLTRPGLPGAEQVHGASVPLHWRMIAAVSGAMRPALKRRLRRSWGEILTWRSQDHWLSAPLRLIGRLVTTPLLILFTVVLATSLKVYLLLKRFPVAPLNEGAMKRVPEFVEQYPLHLYPVVAKSFEFAFLETEADLLVKQGARWVEMAIGEGTFSAKIFPPNADVVGLDLSPYSLRKAVEMPHIKQAVICDVLRPPIRGGHFDVIIANNFLHHVTRKEQTLANWSRVARRLIFNESTPYWASGWATPFLLKRVGFKGRGQRAADGIKALMLQDLQPRRTLETLIRKDYEVLKSASYLSERTFFLCAAYSFIMRCYGPPTPAYLKDFFLSKYMRWLTVPLTTGTARLLIRYDQFQDRSRDAYVSYVCESRHPSEPFPENFLACPRCGGELTETDRCTQCRKQYSRIDQMLFLLPEEMEHLQREYDSEKALLTPTEHL